MDKTQSHTLEDIYARAKKEQTWWEEVLTARSAEEMTQPGTINPEWSFKDLVNHLNGWRRRALDHLAADRARRERPADSWPSEFNDIADEDEQVDQINAWIQEQGSRLSLDEVIAESRAQWDELYSLITTTSEEDMRDPKLFGYLDGHSLEEAVMSGSLWDHVHDEHGKDIEGWIRK